MLGAHGALKVLAAGATWIDMTSNSPAAAAPVREQAVGRGVEVLEAPVGGGIAAAAEGRLQLFVGGDPGTVERHRALLEVLGDPGRIVHVGGHGAGYTAKLLVNLLWFGQAVATTEVLLLGQREGIGREVLVHALACSSASSTLVRRDIEAVFDGDYLPSFGLDRICEELEAVTALARDHGVPWELSEQVPPDLSPRPRPVRARRTGNCWPWLCSKKKQARPPLEQVILPARSLESAAQSFTLAPAQRRGDCAGARRRRWR